MTVETGILGQLVPSSNILAAFPLANRLSIPPIIHTLFAAAKEGFLSQTGIKGPDATLIQKAVLLGITTSATTHILASGVEKFCKIIFGNFTDIKETKLRNKTISVTVNKLYNIVKILNDINQFQYYLINPTINSLLTDPILQDSPNVKTVVSLLNLQRKIFFIANLAIEILLRADNKEPSNQPLVYATNVLKAVFQTLKNRAFPAATSQVMAVLLQHFLQSGSTQRLLSSPAQAKKMGALLIGGVLTVGLLLKPSIHSLFQMVKYAGKDIGMHCLGTVLAKTILYILKKNTTV